MADITDAAPRLRAMNDALEQSLEQSDRLRLTDAERVAVETAALEAEAHQHAKRAATLRGLLERTLQG